MHGECSLRSHFTFEKPFQLIDSRNSKHSENIDFTFLQTISNKSFHFKPNSFILFCKWHADCTLLILGYRISSYIYIVCVVHSVVIRCFHKFAMFYKIFTHPGVFILSALFKKNLFKKQLWDIVSKSSMFEKKVVRKV